MTRSRPLLKFPRNTQQIGLLGKCGEHEGLPVWDVSWSGDSVFLVSCGADRSVVVSAQLGRQAWDGEISLPRGRVIDLVPSTKVPLCHTFWRTSAHLYFPLYT